MRAGKTGHPKVRFYFDPETDAQNAIGFVAYCLSSGKESHALNFLPDEMKHILDRKCPAKDRARIIRRYVKTYYAENGEALRGEFERVKKDWASAENSYFRIIDRLFERHPWPKGKYTGFGTIFRMYPRYISQKVFYFPLNHQKPYFAKKVTGHELLHFLFYDYVLKNYGLKEGAKGLWALSEAFNSVMEGWKPYQKIFHCEPRPYPETMEIYTKLRRQWRYRQDVSWLLDKWLK